MLLDLPRLLWGSFPVLSCLINDRCAEQLCRIELAHGESVQPRFVSAGMALELGPIGVPELDVHAV